VACCLIKILMCCLQVCLQQQLLLESTTLIDADAAVTCSTLLFGLSFLDRQGIKHKGHPRMPPVRKRDNANKQANKHARRRRRRRPAMSWWWNSSGVTMAIQARLDTFHHKTISTCAHHHDDDDDSDP
jgi:hypothetical protein